MKLKGDQKNLLDSIILFIGIVIFVFIIRNYFKPFIWIIIILLLSSPMYNILIRFNISKNISAAISLLLLNICLVLTIYYLGRNIFDLVNNIYNNNLKFINNCIEEINLLLESIVGDVNISDSILGVLHPNLIKEGALTTGEGLMSYFIGNICTFFILVDSDIFKGMIKRILPRKIIKRIYSGGKNIKSILVVQIILVLISTLIIIGGFIILRQKDPFILGIICGILDILPYVGTIIVFIPIIIYNIIVKDYLIAFGLICLYILVQVVREVLEAKLLSNKFNIHPLIIFLSIYIGMKVFGMIGILVGPLYSMMVRDIFLTED